MHLHVQLLGEFRRRASLLSTEVGHWQQEVDQNINGLGIHKSQVGAVNILLEGLLEKQNATLADLKPDLDAEAFSKKRVLLDMEIAASHGILSIFRMMLLQREEGDFYRQILDTADLVAADAYDSAIKRARDWGAISEEEFRIPPLSYLSANTSAQAYTRGHTFNVLQLPLQGHKELKLPIPFISLPFHHARVIWALCAIHHEVGHIVDQDLGLRSALAPPVEAALQGSERARVWRLWLGEMIADVFGVLLGAGGFARSMTKVVMRPKKDAVKLEAGARHPSPYIRIFLIAAMVRAWGAAGAAATADELEQEWNTRYGPQPELAPFLEECRTVAATLLDTPLDAIGGHALREFVTGAEMNFNHDGVNRLERFLRGVGPKPRIDRIPIRLVPVGAELAVQNVSADVDADTRFAEIQEKALAYAQEIRDSGPQFLAGEGDDLGDERTAFLRGLVEKLDFTEPEEP